MKKAFTMIEILVVSTIIVLLTSIAAVSYSQFVKSSRDARRKADLEQVRAALEMYRSNSTTSVYPTTGNLGALVPTYIKSLPKDPKDPTYTYNYTSASGTDYTYGAYLETETTSDSCGSCAGHTCNYCIGPYGE